MTTLARHADWRWAAVAVLPVVSWLAAFHGTAVFAQQGATVQVTIDSPAAGLAVANGQSIEISGWAVDWSAGFGTGIDRVEVYIDGPRGLSPLGFEATYGTFRPDVTEVFGRPDWVGSGFRLQWTLLGLAPGQHTLYVYAHSTYGGWSSGAVTMAVVPTTLASWSVVSIGARERARNADEAVLLELGDHCCRDSVRRLSGLRSGYAGAARFACRLTARGAERRLLS